MIDTRDLMLGNWVLAKSSSETVLPMRIVSIIDDNVHTSLGSGCKCLENKQDNIFGIPITEEILEKCGFELDEASEKYYFKNDRRIKVSLVGTKLVDEFDNKFGIDILYYDDAILICNIKYLHELQNVLFVTFKIDIL